MRAVGRFATSDMARPSMRERRGQAGKVLVMVRYRTLALFLLAALVLPSRAVAAAKTPLDYKAYDGWNLIRGVRVSDDGAELAYALTPEDGDPTLVVHNLETGAELREPRGSEPRFTPDARFVVYTILPPKSETDKAKREKKKPEDQPKNGLGILDTRAGAVQSFDRVHDAKLALHASRFVAFLYEPAPSASPASSPTPSSEPAPSTKKKAEGADLAIRDLVAGTQTIVANVTDYALSGDGRFLAYASETSDGAGDGLRVRALESGEVRDVLAGPGRYTNVTFAPEDDRLAFLSDRNSYATNAPHFEAYEMDAASRNAAPARAVVDASTPGLPGGWAPSDNGTLKYSKDGQRLFMGTAPAPRAQPSGTPEPMRVDLWNWRDDDLQSAQKHDADRERKRTYAAVFHVRDRRFVQLASTSMRDLRTNENAAFALGADDRAYRKLVSWDTGYEDEYAVALADGARRLVVAKTPDEGHLSPGGRFVVTYDRHARAWYSVRTSDGKKIALTARLGVHFYDELDDHPAPPPPYDFGGWTEGDREVLLCDRYDVWAIDLQTAGARNLTGGLGRRERIVFRPVQLDAERDAFAREKPIVLSALDDRTKDSGYYQVSLTGAAAMQPQRLAMMPKLVTLVTRARNAGRIIASEQRFDEAPNLWASPELTVPLLRVSDANPQMGKYLWGTAALVSYRSAWGEPLRGILYLPEELDRTKKHPMLVYIYERFSDDLHRFRTPGPGTSPSLVRYVSNGYVVLVPDIAYRVGHPGGSALDCVLPAVDAVVRQGYVDNGRVGIAGHSWGAYQIAYMLTRTRRFRAAEAGAAVANMTSAYGGIRGESGLVREFQYERDQSRIGAAPWDRTDLYLENSALFHIGNVRTPYLTIHNDADGAVPWQQGIEFFTALRRLDKEAYLFSFNDEDHNLRGREQQKFWTVHLDEFFDHFLRGAPTPTWMIEGVDYLHRGERNVRPLFGEPANPP